MYECPNECGSTTFRQNVIQQETVETDVGGGVLHIDVNGNPVATQVMCCNCGELVHSETWNVYAIVVHPPDTTSDVVNVYADREIAETEADDLRSQEQGIEVAVKEYEVEAGGIETTIAAHRRRHRVLTAVSGFAARYCVFKVIDDFREHGI